MQYDLNTLGPQQFEDMVRALCLHAYGPAVTAYGRGPDGGREVSYKGALPMGPEEVWTGLTVVQAKYRLEPRTPADNLAWLRNEMSKELKAWADPQSERRQRGRIPDNLIIATNVSLSSAAGGGIDTANAELEALARDHGVPLKSWRVWPAQQITTMLTTSRDVRRAFGGFLTPGTSSARSSSASTSTTRTSPPPSPPTSSGTCSRRGSWRWTPWAPTTTTGSASATWA
ncbi:hypothetical protein [Geodermatophilus sp. URMC 62]|uniref:hypothetical protein n=1 Tax=Geodermatophilus sp. URMC 62 TaxID=3423414 RepID=UPI00406C3DE2